MYAHVSELERLLFSHDLEDIILCGHSYGGMVITELAGVCPNRIKALVYLDAFVPLIGQSAFDVVDAPTQSRSRQAASLNGGVVPPPSAADFGVEDEHMRAWCEARFSAFPLRCFEQPCRNAADGTVARWYVKAGRDTRQSFRSVFERIKTEPTWRTAAIDTGHDMMLIDPDAVVEVLRAAAHEALR
jgi:pimeloyl-ACP methyl ester carboxylesterase